MRNEKNVFSVTRLAEPTTGHKTKAKSIENQSLHKNVKCVVRIFAIMQKKNENIVVEGVISLVDSREVCFVSPEDLKKEVLYQTTMNMAVKLKEIGLITMDEYHAIDTMFLDKYKPILGSLFSKSA